MSRKIPDYILMRWGDFVLNPPIDTYITLDPQTVGLSTNTIRMQLQEACYAVRSGQIGTVEQQQKFKDLKPCVWVDSNNRVCFGKRTKRVTFNTVTGEYATPNYIKLNIVAIDQWKAFLALYISGCFQSENSGFIAHSTPEVITLLDELSIPYEMQGLNVILP